MAYVVMAYIVMAIQLWPIFSCRCCCFSLPLLRQCVLVLLVLLVLLLLRQCVLVRL